MAEFLETLDIASRKVGLDLRHPFYDRRLIEYCVALPGSYKLHDGWTRAVQRAALADYLPASVQARTDKGGVGPGFYGLIASQEWAEIGRFQSGGQLNDLVDGAAVRKAYTDASHDQSSPAAAQLFGLLRLEWWLQAIEKGEGS